METGEASADLHANCRQESGELRARIAQLEQTVAELQKELEQLRWRTKQNSQNSSKPPSSDPPEAPAPPKKPPSGRRPGGQPGHEGHTRPLVPAEKVDKLVVLKPEECANCGRRLRGEDPQPLRHQVTELPPIRPQVTEWQQHRLECPDCHQTTTAALPPDVPTGAFGPRLQAMTAYLSGQDHLSKRLTEQTMSDLFGVTISEASVVAQEQTVSQAIAAPVEEAKAFVQKQPAVNADETSWPQHFDAPAAGQSPGGSGQELSGAPQKKRKLGWLWVAVTPLVTVFMIHAHRGADAARALLGAFAGILTTDRWSGYRGWATRVRQLCWAHLIRDFKGFLERGKAAARIGEALLAQVDLMFDWWKRVRDGTLGRSTFRRYMSPVRRTVQGLLEEGTRCGEPKTEGMCRKILELAEALWTFVRVPGIEPTNNAAERALRPAVLYRKGCYGTRSPDGSRFVERILTVVTTLRQQDRNVLEYLTEACVAAQLDRPAPSLLPAHRARAAA